MGFPDSRRKILEILADGQFHSGTGLADQIGIGRSGIWKQLRALSDLGLQCLAVPGKGYCLHQPIELLDEKKIISAICVETRPLISKLVLFDQIESTNSFLMAESGHLLDSGTVCMAEHQTAGRGRRGREWVSPFGANIYLSVLWKFSSGPSEISALSLAMGVAVVRALKQFNITGIGLKWPNDIFWQGKKLGGILVEVSGEVDGPCTAVVGLGLNLYLPETAAKTITQEWVDLQEIMQGIPLSRNRLAGVLINEFVQIIAAYEFSSIEAYLDEWRSYDCLKGKPGTLYIGERRFEGEIAGIDHQGMLLIKDTTGRIKAYGSGEVSFRAKKTETL